MFHGRAALETEARKPRRLSTTLRRFGAYFRPYWPVLLLVAAMLGVNAYVQVAAPELLGQAVDCYMAPALVGQALQSFQEGLPDLPTALGAEDAMEGPGQGNCWYDTVPPRPDRAYLLGGLTRIVLVLLGLYVAGTVAAGLMFFAMSWAGQHVLRTLRVQLFRHLHRLSLGFYTRNDAGDLMSRITNDTSVIEQVLNFGLVQVLSGVVLLAWIVYKMLALNLPYALLTMGVMPLMVLATLWFSTQARRAFRAARESLGEVSAELEESISGVREVQAFSREEENIRRFQASNALNRDANVRAMAYTSALAPTLEGLGYVAIAVVVGVGGILLLRGQSLAGTAVSLGLIVTFLGYAQRFNHPIAQISVLWTNLQSAVAGAERIFELLDEIPEVPERPRALEMPPIRGEVVFDQVWAEYRPGEPVLKGVSLHARPGQTIAIVGPTGAGKTTLIHLIPRFWDVSRGAVRIDGVDIRDVTLESLRRQIGMVLQDTFLFSASVLENIRYGRPDATEEEVIQAAKLAQAHEFIERLPDGYHTVLGERGTGLSQGQRQLIAIARAALANPRILILDEATSSVDTRTERRIQAALERLMEGRTSFVIAHRLSTIRHADQVLVLHQGQIVERGTHPELLARQGFYHALYMSQFSLDDAAPEGAVGPGATSQGD